MLIFFSSILCSSSANFSSSLFVIELMQVAYTATSYSIFGDERVGVCACTLKFQILRKEREKSHCREITPEKYLISCLTKGVNKILGAKSV